MQKNDLFEITITDMGTDGAGIGRYEGMTFFVKDAIIGDTILAKVTKLKKNYGYARVEEIKSPSTFRVEAECELNRRCGGCQIQTLSYEKQLQFKEEKVKNNLVRIGGFDNDFIDSVMYPIVGMEKPFRYRNKAQFPVGTDKDGNIISGFYAARSHNIIPVCDCKLGVEDNMEILARIKAWMKAYKITAYNEATQKGMVRHILLRYGFTTKEIMVCLIINGSSLPHSKELIEVLSDIEGMTSISVNINKKNTNKILGDETECIWGKPYIKDYIHLRKCPDYEKNNIGVSTKDDDFEISDDGILYHISPQSFYQVNPVQTEKLYSTALEFAGLTGKEYVWDLYCGIGTISLFLSQKAKQVYGVEIVPQAIEDAKINAKLNNIDNAEFFVGKAEEVLPQFYEKANESITDKEMLTPDVIVVDPPRKGCDEKCLETMIKMNPGKIVYVSCDSATLARDLKILCQNGYELKKVQAFDQFAHTLHVETVCLLSRKTPV
ncbi:MAG: 23S rRNA (uracil(1939)-C(5))-methyltransferase RlmD [Agathobacter sp.]|nr:23S rRNA (uracil(1939)-C(5))-methyltransferase RlmD [Agathobacter sp.]